MSLTLRRVVGMLAAPVLAIVAALAITSLVIASSGGDPGDFLRIIFDAPRDRAYVNIANQSVMLYLAATAAAIGFRMKLFNIGIEGQYTLGAYTAAIVAGAALLPGVLNVLLSLAVAALAGAALGGLAGLLKVTRGVSEVISTIMLNAIVITLVGYLLRTFGERTGDARRTTRIPEGSQLPGWVPFLERDGQVWALGILAVLVGVAYWFVINKTRFGFDLRATGMSETAAVASGVKVKRMIALSMVLSGGVAGLTWMPALFGSAHYYGTTFQAGLGFAGLAVALLGRNHPVGMVFGAVLFAFLSEQATRLTLETDISASVVLITQGVIVLTVVVAYEVVRRRNAAAEQRAVARRLKAERPDEEVRA